MTTIIKKHYCDICREEVSKIKKIQVPVYLHTYRNGSMLVDRMFEVCKRCLPKVVVTHIHEDSPMDENASQFENISFEYPKQNG
jgi:phosphoribosyl 1,2-cyclic phosphodiesterase